jgi:PAS domain S-box-containing protein
LSLWKSVVDHVPVSAVIASLSLHGRIEYVNHEFTIVTGYEIGDVPTVADWIEKAYPDPDYRALVMGNWQVDASPNHMRRDVSYDVVCRDGTTKRMLLRASLLGPERMIVTMADVTGQHEAEAALRASEARYRALVESSPVPIAVTRGGRILQANAAVAVLFGASAPDALVGRATADLIHPAFHDVMRRAVESVAHTGEAAPSRFTALRVDGTSLEVEIAGARMQLDGEPANMVVFRDLTEQLEAERRQRAYEEKLQQAQRVESLGLLAAGVAHDFNNILVGIRGSTSLAMSVTRDGVVREHLARIESSARRAAELAAQMLACSGQVETKLESVDVRAVLTEMEPLTQSLVRDAIRVSATCEARQNALANPIQLRQVLLNLVSNAAEAIRAGRTDSSGSVLIRVCDHVQAEHGSPAMGAGELEPGSYVVIDVTDDGPGVAPEAANHLFEPFFTTRMAGRGLGLAAVHGIVRAHRGAISVESQPGRGANFRVYLRAAIPAERTPPASSHPPAKAAETCTVLVVDDESIVRDVAADMLQALGYEVMVAASGQEARTTFRSHAGQIGLVIVDMNMPEDSGLSVRKDIASVRPDVPVILASGFAEADVARQVREGLFAGFLQKPFDLKELGAAVERALSSATR